MAPAPARAPAAAPPRWLGLIALAEPLTLAVLLFNVAVVHDAQLAAAVGPVHGGCYLTIIIGLLALEGTSSRARLLGLLPGVGGLLGLRALDQSPTTRPRCGDQGSRLSLAARSSRRSRGPVSEQRRE